jgi:uncharacterized protein (TIGR03067 family)
MLKLGTFSLLVFPCLAVAGGVPEAKWRESQVAMLQGSWKMVSARTSDEGYDFPEGSEPRWIVRGSKVLDGKSGKEMGVLALHRTTPPSLDVRVEDKRVMEGVYSLKGDTWKVCLNLTTEGVKERPSDFSVKGTSNKRIVLTLKRVNP